MPKFEIIYGRGNNFSTITVIAEKKEQALAKGRAYSEKYLGGKRIQACNEIFRACENCKEKAEVYAMGKYAGDWGGWYCNEHIPSGFSVTDKV